MIKNEQFLLLASDSTHFVMKLEKVLQNSQIYCRIIPLPGEISAGCGLSIKVDLNDKDKVEKLLLQENIQVKKYLVNKVGLKKEIQEI